MASTSKSTSKLKTNIKLIILVGLPGAGKSTFSELLKTSSLKVSIINQDNLGRKTCENIFLQNIKNHDITVLDRTNLSISGRKEWLDLSLLNKNQILCVYLATDEDECLHRANTRKITRQ